jgi:predicted N-acetyltransferase YhbS
VGGVPSPYRIEPLDHRRHDRASFSCGKSELDRYLRERATQDARRKFAAPFVAVAEAATVAGYYTLSALSVVMSDLPGEVAKKLPRYPEVPVTLVGRLAVDTRHKGRGLGEHLLLDSLSRSLATSAQVASFAVVVDAIDDEACAFYRHFEFLPFPDQARRLFLPMKAIEALLV